MQKPKVYVIAGPNGAGKTTFAEKFLPDYVECFEFINADLIAKGLAPLDPERAAIKAGKLLLSRIEELSVKKETFAFETTLSGKSHYRLLMLLKDRGYVIHLHYLWLPSTKLALARIKDRVRRGGHNVPREVVIRRVKRSLTHFFALYKDRVDTWSLFDSSQSPPKRIAKFEEKELRIYDRLLFSRIQNEGTDNSG